MNIQTLTGQIEPSLNINTLPVPQAFVIFRNDTAGDQVRAHILFEVIVYSILFVIGAFSNLLVLYKLTLTKRKTSLNILISQLNIADLIVIGITIPIEIVFDITNLWGQNFLNMQTFCSLLQTLRTFGFYLSSMILICISIDRYYAFVHPLTFYKMRDRNKKMVYVAWLLSILLSIPQSTIVHLKYYPQVQGFRQCITFGYLQNQTLAALINIKSIIALYFGPLIVIIYCYVRIIMVIHNVPDFMKKDARRLSKKDSNLTVETDLPKISTSRSFPSYSILTLGQTSFSMNDLEDQIDEFEFKIPLNFEKKINTKQEKLAKINDEILAYKRTELPNKLNEKLSDKLNEKIKGKMNEKLIDKKLKEFDEQVNNFNKKLTEQLSDKLIDDEISLMLPSISEDQIRKRRTSRPRIILNRRSDSLSMPRDRAKINLNKNLNRQKKLIRDLRSIEVKDFKMKDTANKTVKDTIVKDKKKEQSNEKNVKSKTNKIRNLINKAKFKHQKASNKNSNSSKDKSIKPFKLERSRSQEEFSNLKNKRKSKIVGQDLEQVNYKLANRQLYSRELLMSRAKRRTLKMTALIVFAFLACWTPYVTVALWNQLNEESAKSLNTWIHELFFLLAVANSCVNGLVVYTIHM